MEQKRGSRYSIPTAESRSKGGPGVAGPSKYGECRYCFHCSTIECKSRSLNCRGAALRKVIPVRESEVERGMFDGVVKSL